MDTFFSFSPAYSFDIDPEFPGSGAWDCPVFNYDRDGAITPEFYSRWGTPLVVRVEPTTEPEWVGMFPSGGLGGIRTTSPCPSPSALCLVADGLAYVVDVEHPERGALIASDQVTQVVAIPEPPLLLFARFSDVVALGAQGVLWKSDHVFVDDIVISGTSTVAIVCTGYNMGGSSSISLDPATGEQIAGTTMGDLGWPAR